MQKLRFRTPNRVAINTGHAGFDKTCDLIGRGAILSNAQSSVYVLSEDDFNSPVVQSAPDYVLRVIKANIGNVIAYRFRTILNRRTTIHGWVLTYKDGELLQYYPTGKTYKSADVLRAVLPYISWPTKKKITSDDEIIIQEVENFDDD